MLAVDGSIGFITGLCVGRMWAGVPEKRIQPWRGTGIQVRGYAVRILSGRSPKSGQQWVMSFPRKKSSPKTRWIGLAM
jgi:hypothetical protein